MGEFYEVGKEKFCNIIYWYNDNVSKVKSNTVLVAERINFHDKDGKLIAFISAYVENTYYVLEELWLKG